VVSDQPALDKLDALGLRGWAAVVDCTRLGALKPHPDGLRAALCALGCTASRALFVGDRWDSDGRAAALAGCAFLHIDDPSLPR
jgi:phosphoglycolate phosphatase/putative hydrolase of the HAD superfamily